MEAFFRGQRDLFEGLCIAGKEWDWAEHPVFHLMLNGNDYNSVESLDETLNYFLGLWENEYNIPKDMGIKINAPAVRFARLINQAYKSTGRQVVILIDEYDQPLLQNIEQGKEDLHQAIREHLQAFYSVLKAQDRYIRFAILTGISKFSKVSVFSGLNNLNDISLDAKANAICGISETELLDNFSVGISQLAEANGMTVEETKERLKREYDGYHFAKSGEGIYNPFSLLNTFEKDDFSHYWIESGTPSFLIKLFKNRNWDLSEIGGSTCSEMDIKGADRYLANPIPLLFQSGYLTIKGYDKRFDEYTLNYPNEEVAEGFSYDLLKAFSCRKDAPSLIKQFVKYVEKGDAEAFMRSLQSLLADIPYDQILDKELHYENMMYLVMKLMGFYAHTEYRTSNGRIDMVVKTDRYVYVIEFKLHGAASEALAQIQEKGYALPFSNDGKQIVLIGAAFSADTRRLDSWEVR